MSNNLSRNLQTSSVQSFAFDGHNVRTIIRDGEPWWILKDVCDVLGISKYRDCATRLDADEREPFRVDTPGGKQEMTVINESGLYNVILRSDKPDAKRFKKWVTSEVLPQIRKTGSYSVPKTTQELALEAIKALQADIEAMKPKAQYFDCLVDRGCNSNFRDTAKEIGIGPNELIYRLLDEQYIYRDQKNHLRPYARYCQNAENPKGYFTMKDAKANHNDWTGQQTFVTPYGKQAFKMLYAKQVSDEEEIPAEAGGRITVADELGDDVDID